MKRALALSLLLLVSPALAQGADGPIAAMKNFYAVYQSQPAHGIPDATGRLRYSTVLSSRLNKLLADAAAAQAKMAARVKGAGPKAAVMPVLAGDIFTSYFDGATNWQFGPCEGAPAKSVECGVSMTYMPPAPSGRQPRKPVNWEDHLLMVVTPAGWKVDEVRYDPALPSGNTGRLSDMLGMVIAANP